MQNPFLQKDFYIRWSELTAENIEGDIVKALEDAQAAIDVIAKLNSDPANTLTYENTFSALEEGVEPLSRAWGLVNHLDSVCNSPALREAYNKMLPQVTEFFSGIPLNEALWKTLQTFGESTSVKKLSPTKQRYVSETIADFREQGADLPAEKKARVAELQKRLAEVTQKYSENCLDATNAWEKVITNESELAGLPDSALAAARQSAEQKGHKDAWRFTLQAPSLTPVLKYANNEALRREVWEAYSQVGRTEPYENRKLVKEILTLRHEFSQLVGKDNFADHVTERRMVASGKNALDFVEKLFDRVKSRFGAEVTALHKFKADTAGGTVDLLEPWDASYWAEKQRKANYDFDEEALRPYFPIDSVIAGMFEITQKLFGLRIEERNAICKTEGLENPDNQPEVWHQEVKFYELFDATTDQQLGAFYADWHPRESKRSGAWMNYFSTGNRDASKGPHTPHLGLICGNLTPSVGDQPALLTHREVETIFHEFGHLLHHLCGEVEVKSLNGVNVPWDFVELPSQIMENWCWARESLNQFARHYQTGAIIPQELFDKMLAARNYMKASANVRQLSFGKMDLELHINWQKSTGQDLDDFIDDRLKGYKPEYRTAPKSNVFNFSHLFSGPTGYAAGYYSYKWAEVLDADAFTRFQKEGILNAATGHAFRKEILAKGNSDDPARLFKNFMGRDPDPNALLKRDGLL